MESRAIASTPLVSALLDKVLVWQRVDPWAMFVEETQKGGKG